MVNKSIRMRILFAVVAASGMIAAALMIVCAGNNNAKDPNQAGQEQSTAQPKEPPIIIWHYSAHRDKPECLELALSSGLITHVSIGGTLHRNDSDYKKNAKVLEAVRIIKNSGAKLIWMRWLWPGYGIERSRAEDLFDPNYYIQEIQVLRAEAEAVGADFVALDTEPYAYSPMKTYSKGELSAKDLEHLQLTVKKVVESVGKVDFILPAGSLRKSHPYNILAELGENRISENTFFNNEISIKAIKYPYEIFGAYLSTTRKNETHPKLPFFLVSEVFENSQLWSDKKGIFLYPKEYTALEVAKELVAYARSLPYKKAIEQKEPNVSKER